MGNIAIDPLISVFDDMQITVAAQMSAGGYGVEGIEAACGLESGQFVMLKQDPRYKELSKDAAQEQASSDLQADASWDSVEKMALSTLSYDIENHSAEMTVGEKLAVAKQANAARRRAGVMAEGRKRGEAGVINGDVNNGTVINLQLPEVITDRLKKIEESQGEIYEGESTEKFDVEELGQRLTVEDVEKVFGVDVTNPDRAFAEDDDARLLAELMEKKGDGEDGGEGEEGESSEKHGLVPNVPDLNTAFGSMFAQGEG